MSWKSYLLGDILKRRKSIEKISFENEYKLVTIKLYHKGVTLRKIVNGSNLKSTMHSVNEGDFILSGIDARNGAFGIVPQDLDGAVITNDFWCLEPDETIIDKEFLLFLTTTDFFDYICKQSSDGTTQRIRLQKDRFFNYKLFLPTIKEQKVILENLKILENFKLQLSFELTNQLTLVKKLRQQFLQDAVQGKLVAQDPNDEPASELLKKIKAEKEKLIIEKKLKKEKELLAIKPEEIPFEIPENWVWCRLNDICDAIIDCPHSTPNYIDRETGYYGIDTNCINEKGEIVRLRSMSKESYEERIKRLVPTEADIVYAREGSIGLATFIPPKKNICLGQRVMLFRASKEISALYLKHAVTETKYKNQLLAKHRGMGAKHVNVKDIVESLIALPPILEQTRIVQKLDELMKQCNELEASIKTSQVQNEQLLQQVLREALRKEEVAE